MYTLAAFCHYHLGKRLEKPALHRAKPGYFCPHDLKFSESPQALARTVLFTKDYDMSDNKPEHIFISRPSPEELEAAMSGHMASDEVAAPARRVG